MWNLHVGSRFYKIINYFFVVLNFFTMTRRTVINYLFVIMKFFTMTRFIYLFRFLMPRLPDPQSLSFITLKLIFENDWVYVEEIYRVTPRRQQVSRDIKILGLSSLLGFTLLYSPILRCFASIQFNVTPIKHMLDLIARTPLSRDENSQQISIFFKVGLR